MQVSFVSVFLKLSTSAFSVNAQSSREHGFGFDLASNGEAIELAFSAEGAAASFLLIDPLLVFK